jgi:hypothetical protein
MAARSGSHHWRPHGHMTRFLIARFIHLLLLALCAGCACSQPLVIQRVTVIDATGRAATPDMSVVVDGGRIVAVSPWRKTHVPRNAVIVDGAGKFLIPGLWDMHAHGAADSRAAWTHLLYLTNGVVGVRDMFGPPDAQAWRATQVNDEDPSPAIYLGSPVVDGPQPQWPSSIIVSDEAQGRAVVDRQQQRGADFIKVYSKLSRAAYFAISEEAKARGIPFEGHVPEAVTAMEASDAGQKSIEHLTKVADGCSREETAITAELRKAEAAFRQPDASMSQKMESGKRITGLHQRIVETYDESTAQALFARFAKNGTWQCPTLTLLRAQIGDPLPTDDSQLKYLSKSLRASWDVGYYKGFPPVARAWPKKREGWNSANR